MRLVYTALFYGAVPLIVLRLLWRGRSNPAYRDRIGERFGAYGPTMPRRDVIWIHAVSVGETESAAPLVHQLRDRYPDIPLLLTTTTPTGSARVQALFGSSVEHCYLPYDLPGPIARFLGRFRPRLAVILETEIWPNLFGACSARRIPLVIANARLSSRSAVRYRYIGGLVRPALAAVRAIAAQTPEDAERFAAIGADPKKISVTGNIKFDVDYGQGLIANGRGLREELFGRRPVIIAASTHAGEEERLLSIFSGLRQRFAGLLLMLVPRHPERFAAVASLARAAGFHTVRRSDGIPCSGADEVFVLDTIGELRTFYAAADVAFVGGSLVPVGGHNVLEPAMAGLPVMFGPHVDNFRVICAALVEAGGAFATDGESSLAAALERLLDDAVLRAEMGERAQAYVLRNRGALNRVTAILAAYLGSDASVVLSSASIDEASSNASNGAGRPMK
ncbi:lipid IV(A) 3-deoxy-D-manno-octulosonic acid transferase [Methylotetracoccus oryzae]|uniref:lipid IV(A) 3-deoxy-D-manno-octulosonic acid transferase n=1 Tax=Methylotetracoccus oryzae TaxID=1919059 RepID=UPI001118CD10|nr:lipid IV(A) 3-deoxy-D-manno-octulosonic acid transferase [Methylotetracoccus oryzae]